MSESKAKIARKYEQLRAAVHALLNVTTNPPEVERPIRELLYGEQATDLISGN